MSLALKFSNSTSLGDADVYISFQVPLGNQADFSASYGGGTAIAFVGDKDIMSTPVSLADIGSAGITVSSVVAGVIYVSYGQKLASTTSAPAFIGSGTDYDVQFQAFELTMNGGAGDQGDLTAINWFTATMGIESRDASGNTLQKVSYAKSSQDIFTDLVGVTQDATVVVQGRGIRVIGPSSYTNDQPWPSFAGYLQSLNTAGQTTQYSYQNYFGLGSANYEYAFALDCTVGSDNTISSSGGTVTRQNVASTTSTPKTFDSTDVSLAGSDMAALDILIYGQAPANDPVITWGSGWAAVEADMVSIFGAATGAANFQTLQKSVVGEVTSGLVMGQAGSAVVPPGGTTALKDLPSKDWWALDPPIAYAQAQPSNAYYNPYGAEIYAASDNKSYSAPYSDRLSGGPLVNSVSYNGSDVAEWIVTLDAPFVMQII